MQTSNAPTVTLRAMEPEDLDALYRIENDRQLWNIGSTNVPYSRYALHNYIADAKNDIYIDGQIRMMIENEGGIVVGVIDLVNFDAKHQRAELGSSSWSNAGVRAMPRQQFLNAFSTLVTSYISIRYTQL